MSTGAQAPFGPLGVMRSWLRAGPGSGARRRGFGPPWAWIIFLLGALYFLVPLWATFLHSIKTKPDPFLAYRQVFADPKFLGGLGYSFVVGVLTIVISLLIIVPTAYWVRLKVPRLRPVVEFVTLMPFVVPPVVLAFGLIRIYGGGSPITLASTDVGLNLLLVGAYTILSFPYMYRAVDTGLAAIDVRTLTEAAQSLGSGWTRILWRVIFPNLRTALLSGAFLTMAIVIGEYTIAQILARNEAFGPYLSLLGRSQPYQPAAVSLISFALTWLAMGAIAFLGRGARQRVQVAGAR
ncbi:MAG TPA: ABC transporter permease subunit [Candidatus Limnocylindrales bacterium]|jgi:putative spermidine/putrescine transport system permease protein|nr:ABC transporter permease subunit [Candidatus Limnocylindrales bacterium]